MKRIADGTLVHVRSMHFAGECNARIVEGRYDDGWLYRIDVVSGDRLDEHRGEEGQLWVCDFEVTPI